MSFTSTPTRDPTVPGGGSGRPGRRTMLVATAALALVVALIAWFAIVAGDDDDQTSTGSTTTEATATTEPSATTDEVAPTSESTTPSSATTAPAVEPDLSTAVFPAAGGPDFTDPVDAARAFATDFAGFVDPVVGTFRSGDSRSGEVEIRPSATGPVTTVFVRQLGDDGRWWVLGAATDAIQLDSPAALATVSSPVRLQGTSTAFEATVSVEVRQDGSPAPLGEGYVMGGSMGEMGPFDGTVSFAAPSADAGAIVLFTRSMENGQVWEAAVVRVQF